MADIVVIKWHDAETSDGWSEEQNLDVVVATTVGYMIAENDFNVLLASTIGEDAMTNSRIKIPKGMILEITPISARPKRKPAAKTEPTHGA